MSDRGKRLFVAAFNLFGRSSLLTLTIVSLLYGQVLLHEVRPDVAAELAETTQIAMVAGNYITVFDPFVIMAVLWAGAPAWVLVDELWRAVATIHESVSGDPA